MDGLRQVLKGEVYVPAAILLPDARTGDAGQDRSGLTSRQLQILPLLPEGMPHKRIAATLGVTEGTVKQHLKELFKRLRARIRLQTVKEATRLGLLDKG